MPNQTLRTVYVIVDHLALRADDHLFTPKKIREVANEYGRITQAACYIPRRYATQKVANRWTSAGFIAAYDTNHRIGAIREGALTIKPTRKTSLFHTAVKNIDCSIPEIGSVVVLVTGTLRMNHLLQCVWRARQRGLRVVLMKTHPVWNESDTIYSEVIYPAEVIYPKEDDPDDEADDRPVQRNPDAFKSGPVPPIPDSTEGDDPDTLHACA